MNLSRKNSVDDSTPKKNDKITSDADIGDDQILKAIAKLTELVQDKMTDNSRLEQMVEELTQKVDSIKN